MNDLKILVAGCGSIGLRHLQNLKSLGVSVSAYDVDTSKLDEIGNKFKVPVFHDLDMALSQDLTAVFVCTPNHLHVHVALKAAQRGFNLFIEKPLSNSMQGIEELQKMIEDNDLVAMVGFNLRFEPGISYLKKILRPENVAFLRAEYGSYLPNWRPSLDYRKTYSAIRAHGGGIILDDVHEIDYVCWLLGYPTEFICRGGRFSNLDIDVEDIADLFMSFPTCIATIHMDYLQRVPIRKCKIVLKDGYFIEWEFGKYVRKFTENGFHTFDYSKEFEINDMYIKEAVHFLDCLSGKAQPLSSIENGAKILQTALEARKSIIC